MAAAQADAAQTDPWQERAARPSCWLLLLSPFFPSTASTLTDLPNPCHVLPNTKAQGGFPRPKGTAGNNPGLWIQPAPAQGPALPATGCVGLGRSPWGPWGLPLPNTECAPLASAVRRSPRGDGGKTQRPASAGPCSRGGVVLICWNQHFPVGSALTCGSEALCGGSFRAG